MIRGLWMDPVIPRWPISPCAYSIHGNGVKSTGVIIVPGPRAYSSGHTEDIASDIESFLVLYAIERTRLDFTLQVYWMGRWCHDWVFFMISTSERRNAWDISTRSGITFVT